MSHKGNDEIVDAIMDREKEGNMPKFTPWDTNILDDFIQFYKDKHSPRLYEGNYAKFLELNITVLEDTRTEFEELFVGDIPQEDER